MGGSLVPAAVAAKLGLDRVIGQQSGVIVMIKDDVADFEVLDLGEESPEISDALCGPAGTFLAAHVGRTGSPLHFDSDELPDEAAALRVALRRIGAPSMVVFPLFGERGVEGYSAVPCEDPIFERADQRWRVASRGFQRLQLAAACASMDVQMEHDRRRPGELCHGLLVVDADGRILFADGMAETLSGWKNGDVFGRPMSGLPCARHLRAISGRVDDTLEWHDVALPRPVGDDVPVELAAAAFQSGRGALEGRIFLLRDLRPKEAAALDGTSRMLALGMRVAHSADLLTHSLGLGPDGRGGRDVDPEFGETIREARRLVASVLERCVPQEDRGVVDFNSLIADVIERSRPQLELERVRAFSLLRQDLPPVPGDRLELLGVIGALVQSARASLRPAGGTLTTRSWADDTWVYLTVSDDGAGREDLPGSIGRPLFDVSGDLLTTAMDSVKEVVERAGGRVMAESRPSVWTRVTVMLRQERRRTRRDQPAAAAPVAASDAESLTVLVVDDNAALRSVLRRFLERRGHAVMEAADGEEGLRIVKGRAFDRVIVDVQMPVKDGPEFYVDLARVRPDLQAHTIFMTGGFLSPRAERVIDESGRPSVRKPFDLVEMAKTIEG